MSLLFLSLVSFEHSRTHTGSTFFILCMDWSLWKSLTSDVCLCVYVWVAVIRHAVSACMLQIKKSVRCDFVPLHHGSFVCMYECVSALWKWANVFVCKLCSWPSSVDRCCCKLASSGSSNYKKQRRPTLRSTADETFALGLSSWYRTSSAICRAVTADKPPQTKKKKKQNVSQRASWFML